MLKPGMVFRIGSITKQFTSVAIMKLAEEGKVSVTDDIKKQVRKGDMQKDKKYLTI